MIFFFSCFGDRVQSQTKKDEKFIDIKLNQSINNDKSNFVNLEIFIPIKKLVFEKKIDHFNANLTIDVLIVDSDNKIVISDSWDEQVIKNFYEETKTFEDVKFSYDFILEQGEYKFNIIFNDFQNHINWNKNSEFTIEKKTGLDILTEEGDLKDVKKSISDIKNVKDNLDPTKKFKKEFDTIKDTVAFTDKEISEINTKIKNK